MLVTNIWRVHPRQAEPAAQVKRLESSVTKKLFWLGTIFTGGWMPRFLGAKGPEVRRF